MFFMPEIKRRIWCDYHGYEIANFTQNLAFKRFIKQYLLRIDLKLGVNRSGWSFWKRMISILSNSLLFKEKNDCVCFDNSNLFLLIYYQQCKTFLNNKVITILNN